MVAARANSELKELHFTTPVALLPKASEHNKRPSDSDALWQRDRKTGNWSAESYYGRPDNGWYQKGKKGGKGKGKGKGKDGKGKDGKRWQYPKKEQAKKAPPQLVSRTPDNRLICFNWNDPTQGCDGEKCGMVHCCRVKGCYSTDHAVFKCPTLLGR